MKCDFCKKEAVGYISMQAAETFYESVINLVYYEVVKKWRCLIMNVGDRVISDLDNLEYTVVRFGSRDEIEPLPGVKQIGNVVLVEDANGKRQLLYEWEVSKSDLR